MIKVNNASAGIGTDDVLKCTNADTISAWINIIDFDLASIRSSIEMKQHLGQDTESAEIAYKLQLALRSQCLTRLRQLATMPVGDGESILDKMAALEKRVAELESIVEYMMNSNE